MLLHSQFQPIPTIYHLSFTIHYSRSRFRVSR
jgi:hypothetical protein